MRHRVRGRRGTGERAPGESRANPPYVGQYRVGPRRSPVRRTVAVARPVAVGHRPPGTSGRHLSGAGRTSLSSWPKAASSITGVPNCLALTTLDVLESGSLVTSRLVSRDRLVATCR